MQLPIPPKQTSMPCVFSRYSRAVDRRFVMGLRFPALVFQAVFRFQVPENVSTFFNFRNSEMDFPFSRVTVNVGLHQQVQQRGADRRCTENVGVPKRYDIITWMSRLNPSLSHLPTRLRFRLKISKKATVKTDVLELGQDII